MDKKSRKLTDRRELDERELMGAAGGNGSESEDGQNFLEGLAEWSAEEIRETVSGLQRGDITGSRSERDALMGLFSERNDRKA